MAKLNSVGMKTNQTSKVLMTVARTPPAQATNQYREKNCRVKKEPGVRLNGIPELPLEEENENRQQHGQRNATALAGALRIAQDRPGQTILVNLSGR